MDDLVLLLEILVVIAVVISLGPAARGWLNIWGLLLLGVVGVGMVWPLVLSRQHRAGRHVNVVTSATLVLVGGFLLRLVVIFSSETI